MVKHLQQGNLHIWSSVIMNGTNVQNWRVVRFHKIEIRRSIYEFSFYTKDIHIAISRFIASITSTAWCKTAVSPLLTHWSLELSHRLVGYIPWLFGINNIMMTSSNGDIFRVTGHLSGEFSGHRRIPRTKPSDAELWCFIWSPLEQTVEQTIVRLVIWDAIAIIMTPL